MDVDAPTLEGREDGTSVQGQQSGILLTRNDAKKQTGLLTREGQYAAIRLTQLVQENPENALARQNMLIDTDPRHVHGSCLNDLPLPGLDGPRFAKPEKPRRAGLLGPGEKSDDTKETVTYISRDPAQLAQEESILHDRIIYDMKQNLLKLKEYGKAAGFAFDVSKRKGKDGKMQGEKWMDSELEVWKQQALRVVPSLEPKNAPPDTRVAKMEDTVFKLERTLNDLRFTRQQKQKEKAALEDEIVSSNSVDQKDDGSGQEVPIAVLSTLRERIQVCNQRLLGESACKVEFEKEHAEAFAECRAIKAKISEAESEMSNYSNDCEILRVQIRSHFHDVEKVLAQGKLMTMTEIQSEFQGKYKNEIAEKQKLIKKQLKLKEMLREYEDRVVVMTRLMQMQYDPNKDSPRRNELKRKGISFEQVFKTMMERIGESDITRIVDLFQKQAITHNAWTEAVRDQEVRVKLLEDEKRLMASQLKKILAKRSHGVENEVRQFSMDGQKLDMFVERIDAASDRLRHLDGLIAHVKESIRHTLLRMQKFNSAVEVPPQSIADEGENGLLDWIERFSEVAVQMTPGPDDVSKLHATILTIEEQQQQAGPKPAGRPPGSSGPGGGGGSVAVRLRKMTSFFSQVGPEVANRRHQDLDEFERDELERQGNCNLRIRFPPGQQALREQLDKDKEEEEQEMRADLMDDSVMSRDEVKRRNARIVKQRERERAEREAELRGEKAPTEARKGKKTQRAQPSRPATEAGLDSPPK